MCTPVNPVLLYKSGVWGGQNFMGMFSWWNDRSKTRDITKQLWWNKINIHL